MTNKIDLVFFSGTQTGVSYISSLKNNENVNLKLVVTGRDKASGRGRKIKAAPVAEYCSLNSLNCYQPYDVNSSEASEILKSTEADLGIVVDYGRILTDEIIKAFPRGIVNIHYSILPDLRGAEPVRWALLKGYDETGVTLMKIDENIDTGAMYSVAKIEILTDDNYASLKDKLTVSGVRILEDFLTKLYYGKELAAAEQRVETPVCKAVKLDSSYQKIDWSQPSELIFNRIRAMSPNPGCLVNINGTEIKLLKAELVNEKPGSIMLSKVAEVTKNYFSIAASDGLLKILEVQRSGKRKMPSSDYLAGNKISVGDQVV